MEPKPFTLEEQQLLKSLNLSPARNDKDKLAALVRRFRAGCGVWAGK